jgi:aminomethyltransferase
MTKLKQTPLLEEHKKLNAKIIDFGGWLMPVQYTNVIDEHTTTRTKAGLFDICHMGEFQIKGPDAKKFINKIITNNIENLVPNKAFYTCMCYENGTIIDDLFVYCFNDNNYIFVVNAGNINKDLEWIKQHKGEFNVEIKDISDETAKLDIQGQESEKILQKLTKTNLQDLKRFHFTEDNIEDIKTIISRTGYTAEEGFELYFDSKEAPLIWNKLLEVGKEFGLKPIGLGARDTLRIEAGYSLYGHELNNKITPLEADIGFTVKLDKEEFISKQSLTEQKQNLKRKIMAFEMIDKAIPRENYKILKDDSEIGFVTSGTFSPKKKKGLGMGMINIEHAKEDNEIYILVREKKYKAKIVHKPIYEFCSKNKG